MGYEPSFFDRLKTAGNTLDQAPVDYARITIEALGLYYQIAFDIAQLLNFAAILAAQCRLNDSNTELTPIGEAYGGNGGHHNLDEIIHTKYGIAKNLANALTLLLLNLAFEPSIPLIVIYVTARATITYLLENMKQAELSAHVLEPLSPILS